MSNLENVVLAILRGCLEALRATGGCVGSPWGWCHLTASLNGILKHVDFMELRMQFVKVVVSSRSYDYLLRPICPRRWTASSRKHKLVKNATGKFTASAAEGNRILPSPPKDADFQLRIDAGRYNPTTKRFICCATGQQRRKKSRTAGLG